MNRSLLTAALLALPVAVLATEAMQGYTLIPSGSKTTLVDQSGTTVASWATGGYAAYLTDSGTLIGQSGNGTGPGAPYGKLVEVRGTTVLRSWQWTSPTSGTLHHAHTIMPNGHWLAVGYEQVSGITGYSGNLWNEHILEYDPVAAKVVWEWKATDHMSTTNNPRKINPTKLTTGGDAFHFNSVSYDPDRDLVLVSSHAMNEILVVDHSTTTAQAATSTGGRYGHGGDFLFRWGSAKNYGGTSATVTNVFHGGNIVGPGLPGAGHFLVFANTDVVAKHSRAYEVSADFSSADTGYTLAASGEFNASVVFNWYSTTGTYESAGNFGFVQRLPNGNTFITFTKSSKFVEVDSTGTIRLTLTGDAKRALRYPKTFAGLAALGIVPTSVATRTARAFGVENLRGRILATGLASGDVVRVYDASGTLRFEGAIVGESLSIPTSGWSRGVHLVQVRSPGSVSARPVTIL